MQHLVRQEGHMKESQTYTNPDENDENSSAAEERGLSCQLYNG